MSYLESVRWEDRMAVTSVLAAFLQNLSLAAHKGLAKAVVTWQ